MSGRYYTDLALDADWQPQPRAGGDALTCAGTDCLLQDIRLEALTCEGELFWDPDYGWSLCDFMQAVDTPLTRLELEQRVRQKLARRPEVDANSIAIELAAADHYRIAVVWRFVDSDEPQRLDLSVGRVAIEVITIA